MTGERVSPRDVIADAILNSRYAPMRDSASRVADEVIALLEGSGWRIVPADETSDAVRGDLHGIPGEWPERQPTDPDRGQLRDAATPASGRGRQSAAHDHVCYIENGRCQYPGCLRFLAVSDDDCVRDAQSDEDRSAMETLAEIRRRTTPRGDAGNQVAYELSGAALDRARDGTAEKQEEKR